MSEQKPSAKANDLGGEASAPPGRPYLSLVKMVDELFQAHGDTPRGLGYPKAKGFHARYRVLLEVMKFGPKHDDDDEPVRILDVGCATGCILDEIKASKTGGIQYRGIDLSPAMIDAARAKHPEADFVCGDPFEQKEVWEPQPDYVILGGLFQCRLQMSREEMTDYMVRMLRLAFAHCRHGIVFNVMSHHVDWQRDDLFHVPFDEMAKILHAHFTRHYVFRADYGLYEYAVYLYQTPLSA